MNNPPQFRIRHLRAALASILVAQSISAQVGAATGGVLRDPSRSSRDFASARSGGSFAAVLTDSTLRTFQLMVAPLASWSEGQSAYGAQVRLMSTIGTTKFPYKVSVIDEALRGSGRTRNLIKGEAEVDLLNSDARFAGLPIALAADGLVQHIAGSETLAEGSGELDVSIIGTSDSPLLAIGALGYFDHSKPEIGSSTDGFTAGSDIIWDPIQQIELSAEYDFKSDFAGEDSYSAKLLWILARAGHKPTLVIGGGKHGLFLLGLRLAWTAQH
jgi:hypothetical protein